MRINYKELLRDLGELCDASNVMDEILKTYEKRKKLLNKLISSDYILVENLKANNTRTCDNRISEHDVLKHIVNSVRGEDKGIKEFFESQELVESICKILIEKEDFRQFLKNILYETNNDKSVTKMEKKIKVQFSTDTLDNNKNSCSIDIKSNLPAFGIKRKFQHRCEEPDEIQAKKLKSILDKTKPVEEKRFKRETKLKFRFNDLPYTD